MSNIYLIGSLRNPEIPNIASRLRQVGFDVFDDWHAAGPEADDYWQKYEQARGHSFQQALAGYAAGHVYGFDYAHLMLADIGVLVMPAGKSGHLELGWLIGRGKPGYILLPGEPDRFDVMYKLADAVFKNLEDLIDALQY